MEFGLNLLGCAVAVFGGFFFTLWLFRKVTGNEEFRPIINFWGIFSFDSWLKSFRLLNLFFYLLFGIFEVAIFAALYFFFDIRLSEGMVDLFRFILDLTLHFSGWE